MNRNPQPTLWLDNDAGHMEEYENMLREEGYEVARETTVTKAQAELERDPPPDLLILDIMIPIQNGEQTQYPPKATDMGHKTGLVFYENNRERIEKNNIQVLVVTIRTDLVTFEACRDAGIPEKAFITKYDLATKLDLAERVREMIGKQNTKIDG